MTLIRGKIIYRRHGRLGIMDFSGRVYYIENTDLTNCPYESGTIVSAEIIDENMSIARIIGI